ncbi:MAG: KH domain-containing protein [Candidatus Marsarchaeota archaeon]|nr:KH domain-containing protein [Candidatus Marsarchaeota archaeon]MCL5102166.1 KH domain-containing protein [Candidatus Marsarchaeota archaeon]
MRQFVTPGEELPKETRRNEFVTFYSGKPYSNILGFYNEAKNEVVPLEGMWKPQVGDSVIGVIEKPSKPGIYNVVLSDFVQGLIIAGKYEDSYDFKANDLVEAVVASVERKRLAILERPRKLAIGHTIYVKPVRIPRIIGKGETMIGQISRLTGTRIIIGRNGIIWLSGGNMELALKAIKKVENEAHTSGLTERIKQMLEAESAARS